uniref:Uncharacterized protein n=1 Tax=Bactrocera latifrons TaxID=174628 RepID=A0A0K8U472_BACLA
MTMDTNFMIAYVFIILSGIICLFMACIYRRAEPRKRGDRRRKRFGMRFWRSKANNRYQWADSADEAARLAKLTPNSEPQLELLNLYLKEPVKLTEEEKRRSNVSEAAIQAEKELISQRKAMRDAPSTSKHYTRRDKKNEPKPHLEIQVEPVTEQARRRHSMELNVKPATKSPKTGKVKFQKKFTTRAQRRRETDIELRGDTIEVVDDKYFGEHIV